MVRTVISLLQTDFSVHFSTTFVFDGTTVPREIQKDLLQENLNMTGEDDLFLDNPNWSSYTHLQTESGYIPLNTVLWSAFTREEFKEYMLHGRAMLECCKSLNLKGKICIRSTIGNQTLSYLLLLNYGDVINILFNLVKGSDYKTTIVSRPAALTQDLSLAFPSHPRTKSLLFNPCKVRLADFDSNIFPGFTTKDFNPLKVVSSATVLNAVKLDEIGEPGYDRLCYHAIVLALDDNFDLLLALDPVIKRYYSLIYPLSIRHTTSFLNYSLCGRAYLWEVSSRFLQKYIQLLPPSMKTDPSYLSYHEGTFDKVFAIPESDSSKIGRIDVFILCLFTCYPAFDARLIRQFILEEVGIIHEDDQVTSNAFIQSLFTTPFTTWLSGTLDHRKPAHINLFIDILKYSDNVFLTPVQPFHFSTKPSGQVAGCRKLTRDCANWNSLARCVIPPQTTMRYLKTPFKIKIHSY
jgi:hypothetical protein